MLFRVSPNSPMPLGEQIAACVRGAIANGTVAPGERLPSARTVAESLGVNVHTVLRGYQELRDQGLIELRRGRGAVVAQTFEVRDQAKIADAINEVIGQARRIGLADHEILTLVQDGMTRTPAATSLMAEEEPQQPLTR